MYRKKSESLELSVINDYKSKLEVREIANKYFISTSRIYRILKRSGIEKRSAILNKKEMEEKSIELYAQGISIKKISKMLQCPIKIVSTFLKEKGCYIKKGIEYLPISSKNESYFERIDSPEKAYFLGLMYADGNVYTIRNRIQITLQKEDISILKKFAKSMSYNGKFYIDKEKYIKVIVNSKKICEDIIKLGCFVRKSLILEFPNSDQVPNDYIWHFIRGYFDGDGSVNIINKYITCSFTSTESFLNKLSEIFLENDIIPSVFYKRYKDKLNSAGSISISKQQSVQNLYKLMYKDCGDIFMERKKEKFERVYGF